MTNSHFYAAGLESARDLRATVEYVSALPGIDPQRLVLVGHSSGGFASLILASQGLPGVRGVINFAGGRGSKVRQNCSPDKLIEACGLAGRTTRVPTLWVYAQNDSYFPPRLAREMSAAFRQAGGQVEFVMLPPFCRRRALSLHGRAGVGPVDAGGQPVSQRSRVPGVDAATLSDTKLQLNHHGRLEPPPIMKFLVGAVREPPLRVDFHGKKL